MPNITLLDQNTINKIAAGEVIERPASVVKELLENAIDARATAVTVEIKEGGTTFIRVTDNGCGIPKEEVSLAFLRHSTSKIKSVEDLFTISSLGFRGEALASIASVSQVELITKTSEGFTGTRYQVDGGEERALEEVGAPEGTTFIARNLFYNTPARKKFLKTPMTEGAHVADLVEKLALSHPEVSIRFIQNNQNKLHTSGNHNLKDIIYTVYGREIASNLLPLEAGNGTRSKTDGAGGTISVKGFIGKPVIARSNRTYENYYINGRYIKSNLISKAIEEAYKPYMMQHKYPFTMLHFTIEPDLLDINVHPTKMELRFRDGELVYRMVYDAIAAALSHKELIPEVALEKADKEVLPKNTSPMPEPFEKRRLKSLLDQKPSYSYGNTMSQGPDRMASYVREDRSFERDWLASGAGEHPQSSKVQLRMPGIKKDSFQTAGFLEEAAASSSHSETGLEPPVQGSRTQSHVTEVSGPILTTDQNGLPTPPDESSLSSEPDLRTIRQVQAEQLDLFDGRLLEQKSRARHKLIGQLFDTYWLVEFHEQLYIIDQHAAHEKVLYEKTMATLKTREYTSQMVNPPIILTLNSSEELLLKQHMKYFSDMGFEIEPFGGKEYAVRGVPGNLFSIAKRELLMEMIDGLSEETGSHSPDVIFERVASMSCKAAVKGGHAMSAAEADSLIDQLLNLDNPYACPHGRPTIISMSRYELEKKFKRIV